MASLRMGFTLPSAKAAPAPRGSMTTLGGRRPAVAVALATKGAAAGAQEEKGLFDWILGGLQKDEQLLETDPILNKVQDAKAPTVSVRPKAPTPAAAPKSNGGGFGGFGGLFAKK